VRYFTKNIRPHGHIFPPEGNPLDTLEELAPPASKDRLEQLRSMGGNEAKLASQIEKEWMYRYVPLSSVVMQRQLDRWPPGAASSGSRTEEMC